MILMLIKKYTKSWWGNGSFILHQRLFKFAELFFLSATLHMQKKIKEIAYILTSFQALLKAKLFFYHLYSQNKTIKWKYNFYLFVSFFIDTTLK